MEYTFHENIEIKGSRVDYLHEYFRHRGLHEFKKAEFAQLVKNNISGEEDLSQEIKEIFSELKFSVVS